MVMRNRQPREYTLDKDNRIRDKAGNHVFNAVPITDWDSLKTLNVRVANMGRTVQCQCQEGIGCHIDHHS